MYVFESQYTLLQTYIKFYKVYLQREYDVNNALFFMLHLWLNSINRTKPGTLRG